MGEAVKDNLLYSCKIGRRKTPILDPFPYNEIMRTTPSIPKYSVPALYFNQRDQLRREKKNYIIENFLFEYEFTGITFAPVAAVGLIG